MNLGYLVLVAVGGPVALVFAAFVVWLVLGYLGIAVVTSARAQHSHRQSHDDL
jgi:hypothetical protein